MVISFDKSEFYTDNLVELCYKNSNRKRKIYQIKGEDKINFGEEKIIFDLIVKDKFFQKTNNSLFSISCIRFPFCYILWRFANCKL